MRRIAAVFFVILVFGVSPARGGERARGGGFSSAVQKEVSRLEYHALLIGINAYGHGIPRLETSVNDVRAVSEELVSRYGFSPKNIVQLIDREATRGNILRALRELSISLGDNDALLVYYAGHGAEDPATGTGYWIPVDARPNAYETYVSNADIRTYLRAIKAKHIFLVSDSCFSGTMLAERALPGEIDERFYAQKAASRSRVVLTSGGKEPVLDAGSAGHSIFNHFFLKALRENDRPYLIPTQIFAVVGPLVGNNAPQTPQWGSLRDAMDEGGEIVLVNRRYDGPSPGPVANAKPSKPERAARSAEEPTPPPTPPPTKKKSSKGEGHPILGWTMTIGGAALMAAGAGWYALAAQQHDEFTKANKKADAEELRDIGQGDEILGATCLVLGVPLTGVGIYFLATTYGGRSVAANEGIMLGVASTGDRHTAAVGFAW